MLSGPGHGRVFRVRRRAWLLRVPGRRSVCEPKEACCVLCGELSECDDDFEVWEHTTHRLAAKCRSRRRIATPLSRSRSAVPARHRGGRMRSHPCS